MCVCVCVCVCVCACILVCVCVTVCTYISVFKEENAFSHSQIFFPWFFFSPSSSLPREPKVQLQSRSEQMEHTDTHIHTHTHTHTQRERRRLKRMFVVGSSSERGFSSCAHMDLSRIQSKAKRFYESSFFPFRNNSLALKSVLTYIQESQDMNGFLFLIKRHLPNLLCFCHLIIFT